VLEVGLFPCPPAHPTLCTWTWHCVLITQQSYNDLARGLFLRVWDLSPLFFLYHTTFAQKYLFQLPFAGPPQATSFAEISFPF